MDYKIEQLKLMLEAETNSDPELGGYGAHLRHENSKGKSIQLDAAAIQALIDHYLSREKQQPIERNSTKIKVAGHSQTWHVVDETVIDGNPYFLLENDVYGNRAGCIILDQQGKLILDTVYDGFSEKNIADITSRTKSATENLDRLNAERTPTKRYPFNAKEHAHDIKFACNRAHNQMTEAGFARKYDEAERLEKKYEKLSNLLDSILGTTDNRQIAWLTGPEIALAKETVVWADHERNNHHQQNPQRRSGRAR